MLLDIIKQGEYILNNMENQTPQNPLNAKKIALFVVYALVAVCLFMTVLSFNDLPSIIEQLKTVNVKYVLLAVLMVLIYVALYPLSLCILTKARRCDVGFGTTYVIAMTEHFFNGITPLATGGQPFQAHAFSKAKIKLSESTGLLLTNLIIYMAVTTGFSFTGLFFFDTLTAEIDSWWVPVIIIGYSLNFLVLVVMLCLGMSSTLRGWLVKCIYWFCKFRIFRFLEPKAQEITEYFEQVQAAFYGLIARKKHFLLAVLTKIFSFAFLYSATFFILLSLNVPAEPSQLFLALSGTSFAITAVGFMPTPGSSGLVEGSTGQVFKSIIIFMAGGATASVAATANGVMLIWRLLSYYFVMLISLLFYIGLEIYFSRKKRYENK